MNTEVYKVCGEKQMGRRMAIRGVVNGKGEKQRKQQWGGKRMAKGLWMTENLGGILDTENYSLYLQRCSSRRK